METSQSHGRKRIIIIGGGVAGSEAGTYLGDKTNKPVEIVEIESEARRKFGGWGFQSFPNTETTNLALRKMYLGREPNQIIDWANNQMARRRWPDELRKLQLVPDRPFPRMLMREYVAWRRANVQNPLASYKSIIGEAMKVSVGTDGKANVQLRSGQQILGDKVIVASGSISVKIPDYLKPWADHERVIPDPLIREGHERRALIPLGAKILILGTGLTGEEQVNVLLKLGHANLTLLSRGGLRHYTYPENQKNTPLVLAKRPEFLLATTPEEFNQQLSEFYADFLNKGHSPEDILSAVRPFWNELRGELGGCVKAAERLRTFRRMLAVNSIGVSWEVGENLRVAEAAGKLTIDHGYIKEIKERDGQFDVYFAEKEGADEISVKQFDYIINAVGRSIIRHPLWDQLLKDGLAKKHAGIGVRVNKQGQMINEQGVPSNTLSVVGMARAGDHALRHGFLGNTAFNVPQVRSHVYDTVDALIKNW
jgi:uncharacterized NAD(P)/FAD-binding protein YdhS